MIIEKPVLTEEQEEWLSDEIGKMLVADEADDMFLCGFEAAVAYLYEDFQHQSSLRTYIKETSEMAYEYVVKTKKAQALIKESLESDVLEIPFEKIIELVGVKGMLEIIGGIK